MDDVRIGRAARALRRRKGWRQVDVATRVGCHQTTVSRLERGHLADLSLRLIRRIFGVLDASFDGVVRWRGADIDRLLDADHADSVETAATIIGPSGWRTLSEVSYSEWGERGSIDLLAVHDVQHLAAVFEVKTEIGAVEATIRKHDEKVRLAPDIVARHCGWRPRAVARILVIRESQTARRVVARHEATFRSVYPATSAEIRRWLRRADGPIAGIWFLSSKGRGIGSQSRGGPKRVRPRRLSVATPPGKPAERA